MNSYVFLDLALFLGGLLLLAVELVYFALSFPAMYLSYAELPLLVDLGWWITVWLAKGGFDI
jgi:hypothetical protein